MIYEKKEDFDKHITKICFADCKSKYSSQKKIEECINGCSDVIAIL